MNYDEYPGRAEIKASSIHLSKYLQMEEDQKTLMEDRDSLRDKVEELRESNRRLAGIVRTYGTFQTIGKDLDRFICRVLIFISNKIEQIRLRFKK